MPLWIAAALFFLCLVGAVLSFRAYFRGGGKIFLAAGIAASFLCFAALGYVALALLFVSSVN
jgi:hypothetical protein